MPKAKSKLSRKSKRAQRAALVRKKETPDERESRLENLRIRAKVKRSQESDSDKKERLRKNRLRKSLSLKNESELKKSRRLAEQSIRTALKRKNEPELEKTERLSKKAYYAACKRKLESVSERERRLEKGKIRAASYREAQKVPTTNLRNSESKHQKSVSRSEEKARHTLRSISQRTRSTLNLNSGFNYTSSIDYIGDKTICIGEMESICRYCDAKKWPDECEGMCCAGGKVKLDCVSEPPEPLQSLLKCLHPLSKHFFYNIRHYNSLFEMTSFRAKEIREDNCVPTFKIQGQVHHLIGSLFPVTENPKFLQIYFLSHADQLSLRQNIKPNLKQELIQLLQNLLSAHNSYILMFKSIPPDAPGLELIIRSDKIPTDQDRGRYNIPCTNEVTVLLENEDKGPRDIVLYGRNDKLHRVSELHQSYDPLQYPIMFVNGDSGYFTTIPFQNPTTGEENFIKTVSCRNFYAYRIMVRQNQTNYLLYYRQLFNQYIVDMMAKIISDKLNYIQNNQKKLRAENFIHLRDALNVDANINPQSIGQQVILPSSFTGSSRYMYEKTQDAMTYVRKYGRPDLFITFMTNPEWVEIQRSLFEGQKSCDRHDLIARVFHLKLKKLINLLTKNCIYGEVLCYMYSVEWQIRGLPHAQILLWLKTKIQPEQIDSVISAEIPDSQQDPLLYEIVTRNMIHGPCGEINKSSPCMVSGKCNQNYPRDFMTETQTCDDGFPKYRRRSPLQGGQISIIKTNGEIEVDNRWIVPYSPVLSRCFCAHINVEYCDSIKAIKYLCKYIKKSTDNATATLQANEIDLYLKDCYISSAEAAWRILEFSIHEHFPMVVYLSIHLENGKRIFSDSSTLAQRLESPPKTTLTAFFDLCASDDFAKTLFYCDVPSYYTWKTNRFERRKRGQEVPGHPEIKKDFTIGRVYTIHPRFTDCFYLRMLLHYVKGPMSFMDLRTVNGVLLPTYQEACREFGLLESDEQWTLTLKEAVFLSSPSQIRDLFIIILIFCHPSNPLLLWKQFKESMCEDILYENQNLELEFSEKIFNKGLIIIENKITFLSEKCLSDFNLPMPLRPLLNDMFQNYNTNDLQNSLNENKLNADQLHIYNIITDSVFNSKGKLLFIDAPSGTGKTFLINLLLAKIRAEKKVAISVASSGIAATLMSGGKTAHSTFKLPLKIIPEEDAVCSIRKNGALANILKEAVVVFWDECTMTHRAHLEAVNRTLQNIRSCTKIMGGLTFVLCGDFRQTLPVIPRGTRANVINACLKTSTLWPKIEKLSLRTNMRAVLSGDVDDLTFAARLLEIGAGTSGNNTVISDDLGIKVTDINALIQSVYPDIENLMEKGFEYLYERAIIAPKNSSVDEINEMILQKFTAESRTFLSIDSVVNTDDSVNFPLEFLQSLNPSGVPPHKLYIKVGSPIILLRNLDPPKLCNGTRLRVMGFKNNLIEVQILTGPFVGKNALIPRIPIIPSDYSFQFKRLQYPVKNCFAMTINKAQGQTFKCMGIDLRGDCFAHGQLYSALSRVGRKSAQYILLSANERTLNIVYPEVLS